MSIASKILILVIALLHLYFLWLEMFAWTTSAKKVFRTIPEDLFEKTEETELFNYIKKLEKTVNEERFYEIVNILLENAHIINDFFDNVMVIAEKNEIKNNRLELLQKLQKLVDRTIFI